jgi:hypothetical protein
MKVYFEDQVVVCEFEFEDDAGVPVDPTSAMFTITPPDEQNPAIYTLPDATRTGEGIYTLRVTANQLGQWRYEAVGDGCVQVGKSYFLIRAA